MKKYLMTGVAALAMCAAFTSCSKTDLYDEGMVKEQKEQAFVDNYEKAFEAAFGKVGSNVDWGFGSRAKTRGVVEGDNYTVKKDQWENFPDRLEGNTVPADVTTEEANYVYEWFQKEENKGLTEFGQPWSSFFIQQVKGTMDKNKQGIWYKNGEGEKIFEETGGMDYLIVGDGNTMIHSRDFNAADGGPHGIIFVKNSSALKFGYHSSWDNSERLLFKMAEIEVPGRCFKDGKARTGWYVGLSLLGEMNDNGKKIIGYQRKDFGDDWILKVVPGNGELPYRIIAEDLTAAQSGDFDFNDVVVDVVGNNGTETTLKLVACGGTLPLKVGGKEVHALYGQSQPNANGKYDMFNTGGASKTHEPVEFKVQGVYDTPDKLNNLLIEVEKEGTWVPLTATRGKAACKILVDTSFPIVPERHGIASEQEDFTKYVSGEFKSDFWWKRL